MNAEFWMLPGEERTIIVLSNFDPPTASRVADEIVTTVTGSAPPPLGGKLRVLRK
jgi:hypothetical protein